MKMTETSAIDVNHIIKIENKNGKNKDKKMKKKAKTGESVDSSVKLTLKDDKKKVKENASEVIEESVGKIEKKKRKLNSDEDTPKKKLKGILKIKGDSSSALPVFEEHEVLEIVPRQQLSGPKPKKQKMKEKRKFKKDSKLIAQDRKKDVSGQDIVVIQSKEYLNTWKHDKDSWKFLKVRQTWLLQNMYDTDAVDEDSFTILLEYLTPLKGKARDETVKKAEEKVNEEGVGLLQAERARVVAQALA